MRVQGVLARCWWRCLVIAGIASLSPVAAWAAEQQFPYTAFVRSADAQLRAGPGRNFYATHQTEAGQKLEVHRHGSGGWCAVRPPNDSFSWVQADALRVDSDGIGIVLRDKTPCHVGSGISDLWDVVQVKLNRGEEVEVLDALLRQRPVDDASENEGDPQREMWCKIAPPSGEFRWIELATLEREPPTAGAGVASSTQYTPRSALLDPGPREDLVSGSGSSAQGIRLTSGPIKTNGWKQSRNPLPREDDAPVARMASVGRGDGSPFDDGLRSNMPSDSNPTRGSDEIGQNGVDLPRARPEFQEELDAIDFELSRIVTAEPSSWNFAGVQTRVDAALGKAQSALERGKVRLLQSRVAKFDDIRVRQSGTSAIAASPRAAALPITLPATTVAADSATEANSSANATLGSVNSANRSVGTTPLATGASGDPNKFDGVGKLTKVVSQRPNAPKYALVNSSNDVVSFVTPAPGVNLQAFEGQYVGVTGQRGFMPELKKPHVTALRIAPVEGGVLAIGRSDAIKRR